MRRAGIAQLGLTGIRRKEKLRTTIPSKHGMRARDLVDRDFTRPGTEQGVGLGRNLTQAEFSSRIPLSGNVRKFRTGIPA